MASPRILFAAVAVALLSTAAMAVPPTASQVSVPAQAESGRRNAKLQALFPSPELRLAFRVHMKHATKDMSRAERKSYRKQEMQKIRMMTDAQKASWRQQLEAEWNALPAEKRDRMLAKLEARMSNPRAHRHHRDAQPDAGSGDEDMGTPQ